MNERTLRYAELLRDFMISARRCYPTAHFLKYPQNLSNQVLDSYVKLPRYFTTIEPMDLRYFKRLRNFTKASVTTDIVLFSSFFIWTAFDSPSRVLFKTDRRWRLYYFRLSVVHILKVSFSVLTNK